ncbi:MAG: peptidylprolyl isomerase [Oscillospiraceae bacterium]|nr:peptidylprolyl isomerase [Oscillospiraceae bacterium]
MADITAIIHTSMGDITIKLFTDQAPKAVENFLTHAANRYYDGVIFHRVIPDFMVQGGDPTGTGRGGESIWGEPFADECRSTLPCVRGALAMANAGPGTNGSQFFIIQAESTPWLDGKHTVFGQVTAGMDVVDAMAAAPRDRRDKPLTDIAIQSIETAQG